MAPPTNKRLRIGIFGACVLGFLAYVAVWVWFIVFSSGIAPERIPVVTVPEELGERHFGKIQNPQQ